MKTYISKKNINSFLLLLFLMVISIISVSVSIYYEYQAQKRDYLDLFERQTTLFINTLSNSVQNALVTAEQIENELNKRIIANLKTVELLDQTDQLSNNQFTDILSNSGIEAIHVYNINAKLINQINSLPRETKQIPVAVIRSRLKNTKQDTVLLIYDNLQSENEFLTAFVSRKKGGLIAAIISKDAIQSIRNSLGIGYYLKRFQAEKNIEYIVIQNSATIVAGSFNGYTLSTFSRDPLLNQISSQDSIYSRILNYDNQLIFESISPFKLNEQPFGILRLGISMTEYERFQKGVNKRLFIFGAALIIFGVMFINFLISYRHRKLLRRDLINLQDYTSTIFENLATGVITVDQNGIIQSINKQALDLLDLNYQKVIQKPYSVLPAPFHEILQQNNLQENRHSNFWLSISDRKIYINLRSSFIIDDEGNKTSILLLDDITDQKHLDEQIKRNQMLTSMRNLASAVAHEIKNPLNAIKLIMNLVIKKSKPTENTEEYYRNLNSVQNEIQRISTIIDQYLKFAAPPKIQFELINFNELVDQIFILYNSLLESRNIVLTKNLQSHKPITGDTDQLKQVFINIIKNAEEAIEGAGEISISGKEKDDFYEIQIVDSGKGIAADDINSIFDFYYSTKKGNSGIGLAVVSQIISAHQAKIHVESKTGKGTIFVIQFPYSGSDQITNDI